MAISALQIAYLGNPDPIWAKCLKSGKTFQEVVKKIYLLVVAQPQHTAAAAACYSGAGCPAVCFAAA